VTVQPRPRVWAGLDDATADRRIFLAVVAVLAGALSTAISVQAVLVLGVNSPTLRGIDAQPLVELVVRVSVNLATVALAMVLGTRLRLTERRGGSLVALLLLAAVSAAAARGVTQSIINIYGPNGVGHMLADAALATLLLAVSYLFGLAGVFAQRRIRDADRQRIAQAAQAATALASLQEEELRVRREVADALHGTVQGRVVMLQAELADIARRVGESERMRLDRAARELEDLRENELRAFSAALYPEGIDRGLVPALRSLVGRIPAAIGARFTASDEAADAEGGADGVLDVERRLVLVRVAEEAVSNALRHGNATAIAATLGYDGRAFTLAVADDGVGVASDASLSGLARLRERMQDLGGGLDLAAGVEGGAVLTARLPASARV
jgi:signal transduction histidine kinase